MKKFLHKYETLLILLLIFGGAFFITGLICFVGDKLPEPEVEESPVVVEETDDDFQRRAAAYWYWRTFILH